MDAAVANHDAGPSGGHHVMDAGRDLRDGGRADADGSDTGRAMDAGQLPDAALADAGSVPDARADSGRAHSDASADTGRELDSDAGENDGGMIANCQLDHGGCDPRVTCTDTPSGPQCGTCPAYYRGDGETGCIHLFTREIGADLEEDAWDIAIGPNGSLHITGDTNSSFDGMTTAGGYDAFALKLNGSGDALWTRQVGSSENEEPVGIATDPDDDTFMVGSTLGALPGGTHVGDWDILVARYDSGGQLQWIRQLGTTDNDYATSVKADAAGNAFVVGFTAGGLDGNTSAGGNDLFLLKYDRDGQRQWTHQFGTSAVDAARDVAIDRDGNLYVAGVTSGDLDGNTSAGGYDSFLIKYDRDGHKQWTQQYGSSADEDGEGVALDMLGNIYVAGQTKGDIDGTPNAGNYDMFLVKYDVSGQWQWARQLGSSGSDEVRRVAVDAGGNAYVFGNTSGGFDGNSNLGGVDFFLVKYDGSGQKQWVREFGTIENDTAGGIAIDASGAIYVTGSSQGSIDGNPNAGNYDVIVMKFDAAGHEL
jgi:beta-propeller repeat-containing protein